MASLVTLAAAKLHLRIDPTENVGSPDDRDTDLQRKLDQAEAIILDYLKLAEVSPPLWTVSDVPAVVEAAILYQFAELDRFRGDDPEGQGPASTPGDLAPWITNVLRRYRDPALA